jgi:DNA repair exonuclease SbcCD ATPase subunit
MVTSNGTRNVISEADLLPQIAKEEKLPMQDLADALRILEKDTRLVRREQRNKVYFYEIVSEFLVPWIFRQKELRESTRERGAFRRKVIGVSFLIFLLGVVAWAWQVKTFRETNLYIQLSTTQKNLEEERGVFKQKEKAQAEEIDRKSKMLRQIENSLRAEILQLESSIVDLNSREGAAKERISELVEGLKEEDQQTTQLHVSLQNQQAENARIQEQATHLQQDLLIEQTENTRLGQQLGQLQQTVQSEQTDNARLGQQVEQLQNGVQERQTENATLRRQTDQLQREVTEAKNSAQERLTRIEQLRAELGQMKVDVATCRTSKDGLNELFEQTKTELETCRAQSGSSTSPPP